MEEMDHTSKLIAEDVLIKFMEEVKNGDKNSLNNSSMENPFVLPKNALNFVELEYKLIEINCMENYFDCERIGQSLKFSDNKIYDIIEIEYKNSPKDRSYINKLIYFDITDCYKNKYRDIEK
jgi:hypothetical protein